MEWAVLFFIIIASSVFIPGKWADKLIDINFFNEWTEKRLTRWHTGQSERKNNVNK